MPAVPGDPQLQPAAPDRHWWVAEDDKPKGPYHEAYLVAAVRMGVFQPDDQACPVNGTVWKPLEEWPAFAPACARAGAAPGGTVGAAETGTSQIAPPPPPRVAAPVPGPAGTPAPDDRPSRFAMSPMVGLLVGGTVGGILGMLIGALVGVGLGGGFLMGAVTGALAGALAASSGKKSDKKTPAR